MTLCEQKSSEDTLAQPTFDASDRCIKIGTITAPTEPVGAVLLFFQRFKILPPSKKPDGC